jgi:heme/copper-type cytochrome/quinol oxidase subunit 4
MIKAFARGVPSRVKGYVKENWGAPFILGFMVLLMVAAVSLSTGLAVLANEVAIYAYYALVVGVVLQLVCFLKCNKKNSERNYESS